MRHWLERIGWIVAGAFAVSSLAVAGVTLAQDTEPTPEPEPQPAGVELTVGAETTYPLDPSHPLIFYVDRMVIDNEGVWIEPRVFLRTEQGFVALTPCDDLTVPCDTAPMRATGPLQDAVQGTSFGLARITN